MEHIELIYDSKCSQILARHPMQFGDIRLNCSALVTSDYVIDVCTICVQLIERRRVAAVTHCKCVQAVRHFDLCSNI